MTLPLNADVLASRYRLDGRIAAGGMGEVWRALDLVLRRPVAVKLLRPEYAEHAETLARFRAEAQHAAALSHPGIAQVYDYGDGGPGQPPFLVMELVDGPPLTQLLTRGPLGPARTLDVVAQVASGLAAAHAAGLVHRDIKPGNLLLDPGGKVKITDFGIAHAAGSAPLTRTGTLIGTPAYLAPERLGGAPAGPASDLYSLGIVAHECLAGAAPFSGTAVEVALAHQQRPLPPLPPTVPREVAALIADLTARDPADRPASAGQVAARAARLRSAIGGEARYAGRADRAGSGDGAGGTRSAEGSEGGDGAGSMTLRLAGWPPTSARTPDEMPDQMLSADDGDFGGHNGAYRLPRRRDPRRPAPGRRAVLLVAAVALIVGLAAWLVADLSGSATGQNPAAGPHATKPVAGRFVEVNGAALAGQPASAVARRLRQIGLLVRLRWVPTDHRSPGTVLWVRPEGKVQVGTTVLVAAARRPGHGHGRGRDHGNGNNQGQGGD